MTNMENRRKAIANMITSRSKGKEQENDPEWNVINRRIHDGQVIPIVSNSLFLDMIFSDLLANAQIGQEEDSASVTVKMRAEDLLSQVWAERIRYPLPDTNDLARVCLYNRVISKDDEESKAGFIDFMKDALLGYAENLGIDGDVIKELYARFHECTFADLVSELELPVLKPGEINPLETLARLPLPIYVTTSFYNFLERALLAEGKHPVSQVCWWNSGSNEGSENTIHPTPESPLVYHLFGSEEYPKTLVLSEEDYLNFLVKVTTDLSSIPVKLRSILSTSSLLLLGYRLQDWDFRVMFRGIVDPEKSATRGFSLAVQLSPDQQFGVQNIEEARKYLETYLKPKQFIVSWNGTSDYLNTLWEKWNKWRLGQ